MKEQNEKNISFPIDGKVTLRQTYLEMPLPSDKDMKIMLKFFFFFLNIQV